MNINLMVDVTEKKILLKALQRVHWDRHEASRRLEIPLRKLYRLVHKHGLHKDPAWKQTRRAKFASQEATR